MYFIDNMCYNILIKLGGIPFMQKFISVLDFKNGTDSERIQNAVNKACKEHGCTVIIPANDKTADGIWEIDKAIEIYSNTHILLDGAHLRLKDGIYDNIFRTANLSYDKYEEVSDITIKGQNGAILDGGVHNRLTEYNYNRDGLPHIYKNLLILLFNVTRYEISNFDCHNPRYWCINQVYCSYGIVRNINFLADGKMPNQDGVNIRIGCHHILVENIGGRTGDDTVAITGVVPSTPDYYLTTKSEDVHHVVISNVKSTTHQTIVALRVSDGVKLHDVLVENVESIYDENNPETFLPWGTLRIGEGLYYRHRPSVDGEIYNITVRNVKANSKYGVALSNSISDSVFENIKAIGKCPAAIMTDVKWWTRYPDEGGGVTLERCIFKDISYFPDSIEPRPIGFFETPITPAVFLFDKMKKHNVLNNVYINGVESAEGIKLISIPEDKKSDTLFVTNVK